VVSLDLTQFHSSRLLEVVGVETVAESGVVRYRVVLRISDTGELSEVVISVPAGRESMVKDALLTALYNVRYTRRVVLRESVDGGEGEAWM